MKKRKKKTGYIFVYGTLKKGCVNFEPFFGDIVESVRKVEYHGAKLYDLGPFPAMKLNCLGKVVGELVKVNDIEVALWRCDQLEGYNPESELTNIYNRVEIEVEGVKAWTYEFNLFNDNSFNSRPVVEEWIQPPETEAHFGKEV